MPSPFPGMDPWLEGSLWPDVHASLIPQIRAALVPTLPSGYFANIDQYVWLGSDEDFRRHGRPDVFLTGQVAPKPTRSVNGQVAVAEPTSRTRLAAGKTVRRKLYIRVIDVRDRSVITVIELLSPSDKSSDRRQYLAKRAEFLAAGANLVEIDLHRSGRRPPMGKPRPPDADYYVLVSRATAFPTAEIWGYTVRERIPVIPVPLCPDDDAISLDIKACLDEVYDTAGYAKQLDYTKSPEPGLRTPDAEWAAELLKKSTRRKSKGG